MSRAPDADRNQEATCYIGNLDERASDALVWELMIQAGPVINVHLPKDRITSNHQGYGFTEFQTEQDAEYACKIMNGIKLFGKPLRVNKASSDRKQIDIGANLFIRNLDSGVDERILYETFSAFGNVVGIPKIARDEISGASKGYGFVSFDAFESSDAAVEALNNQFLLNKPINVLYATKKDGKNGERHGTPAERLLAAQARKNNALPPLQRIVPHIVPAQQSSQQSPQPPGPPAMAPGPPPPPTQPNVPQQPYGMPPGSAPPPPPPGIPVAGMHGGQPSNLQRPPPPPGFNGVGYPGGPPPPPPSNMPAYYGGQQPPPPPPPGVYSGPPPNHYYMTGTNNAPLGPRHG
ncbi:hypothetical protein L7F22_043780 [Adiantum nelumboides]|nr:hypothetical protein [Adiantum nelumboides]